MLSSPRLTLRPLGQADAPALFSAAACSLDALIPWLGWAHPAYDLDDAEAWVQYAQQMWDLGREYGFGIWRGDALIGCCGLDRLDWAMRCANLGYWISTPYTGQGYATEAGRAVVNWGFAQHNLVRIEIVVGVGNEGSVATALAIGALPEGRSRNRLLCRGQPRPAEIFGLVPGDVA